MQKTKVSFPIDRAISEFFEKVDRRGRIKRRLQRVMDKSAETLKPKINEWLAIAAKRIVNDLNKKFIKERALDITTELTDWTWIIDDGARILKPALLRILGNGADEAFIIGGIEARFDILNPRSVKWASTRCATLVREVTKETRIAIRRAIREGIRQGKSMPMIVKRLRPMVGLTEKQMMAVINREEWLIINRPELSGREINRRLDVYGRRLHRKRADMIARTESAFAVDEGTLQGYLEAGVEEADVLPADDACDDCIALAGDNPYKIAEASGVLPAHPDCRCCWCAV